MLGIQTLLFWTLLCFIVALALPTVNATKIYVNVSSTKIPLGTQSNPCKTLACGLRRSKDGNTIFVTPGTYTGENNCNLCNATNCPSNFTMIGTGLASEVIISAYNISSDRAFSLYNVLYAKLANFTFQNFFLLQHLTYSEQLLTNTIPNGGGAVTATISNLHFSNVIFQNNSAAEGGAVRAINSNVTFEGCTFLSNVGGLYGGAVLAETSNIVVVNSVFIDNVAEGSQDLGVDGTGGAIYAVGGATTAFSISFSHFQNNSAGQSGGAMYIRSASTLSENQVVVTIADTVFESNTIKGYGNCLTIASCDAGGGAVYIDAPTVTITRCNFTNNKASTLASNSVT